MPKRRGGRAEGKRRERRGGKRREPYLKPGDADFTALSAQLRERQLRLVDVPGDG